MLTTTSRIMGSALLLTFCAFAEETTGPKVEFTGYLDADMAASYDKGASQLVYQANHEADLVATAKFSDKVSASLGITSYTPMSVPAGGTPVVDSSGAYTRWPSVYFDGVWASYETDMGLKLLAGDFVVTEGVFSFYTYKRPLFYGSVMKETYFRGFGADFKGASLYVGASDTSNVTTDVYAAYTYSTDKFSVKPFAFVATTMKGADVKAGLTGALTLGDYSANLTYGFIKGDGLDASHTVKLEGSAAFGAFSVSGSAFYAFTSDNAPSTVDVPEESFFYLEPDYKISDLLTVGSTFELHTRDKGAKDSDLDIFPTLYVNPADKMQLVFWGGPTIYVDDSSADPVFAFGSEVIASF